MMRHPLLRGLLLAALVVPYVGCGPKDADPNAKIDAPGYYNGPMKSKGRSGGAQGEGDNETTAPAKTGE